MEWHKVKIYCKKTGDSISMFLSSKALVNMSTMLKGSKEIEIKSETYENKHMFAYLERLQEDHAYNTLQESLTLDLTAICVIEKNNTTDTLLFGPVKIKKELPSEDIIEVFL